MPNYWLVKTEPADYSFTQLEKDTQTLWDGVRNPQAVRFLAQMKTGDFAFIYHTGDEKAIVGIAEAGSEAYSDPRSKNPRNLVILLRARRELPRPVTLAELRGMKEFKRFALLRQPRLSVMPVESEYWDVIMRLAEGRGAAP